MWVAEHGSNEFEDFLVAVSNRQVDRASDVIRAHASGAALDRDPIAQALDIAEEFRVGHASALDQSVADLQSTNMELALPSEIGRRLKRMETIQGKLVREPRNPCDWALRRHAGRTAVADEADAPLGADLGRCSVHREAREQYAGGRRCRRMVAPIRRSLSFPR